MSVTRCLCIFSKTKISLASFHICLTPRRKTRKISASWRDDFSTIENFKIWPDQALYLTLATTASTLTVRESLHSPALAETQPRHLLRQWLGCGHDRRRPPRRPAGAEPPTRCPRRSVNNQLVSISYVIMPPPGDRGPQSFPHNGKTFRQFSTQWKKFSGFFHTMEKRFPQCGKLGFRAVFGGGLGCSLGAVGMFPTVRRNRPRPC